MKVDELERILNDALASYSRQEPRAGLEARVMARVQAEGKVSRGSWLALATAACAVSVVAISVVTWPREMQPQPVAAVERVVSLPHQKLPSQERLRPAKLLARRESFPSPVPLTPEERALIAFVQQAPEVAAQLAQPAKPLEIEAINIQPIQIDGLETGELK